MKKRTHNEIKVVFSNFYPDSPLTLELMTGDVNIPRGNGRWAISCGPGSGKTTCIKSIISQRWREGVLFVVPTIKDVQDMITELVSSGVPSDELLGIHGNDKVALEAYRKDPDSLKLKKVVIITHPRFWSDPISFFIENKHWVLIDELNIFLKPMTIVPKYIFPFFFYTDGDPVGSVSTISGTATPRFVHMNDEEHFNHIHKEFISGSSISFHSKDDKVSAAKRKITFDSVTKYLEDSFRNNYQITRKQLLVHTSLGDIPIKDPFTGKRLIIFDGTYDVLKGEGGYLQLIDDIQEKYCSPVWFERFQMPINRKTVEAITDKVELEKHLEPLVDEMERQVNLVSPSKVLFFTWMDISLEANGSGELDDIMSSRIKDKPKILLCDTLRNMLLKKGISDSQFSITYRGSGLDKGTNQYSDYGCISFLGDWNGGKQAPSVLDSLYGMKVKFINYKASLLIQAIARGRIRKHDGDPMVVFYSSDFDKVDKNGNVKESPVLRVVGDYLRKTSPPNMIAGIGEKPYIKKDMEKLIAAYPDIHEAILRRNRLYKKISLSDLSLLLGKQPRGESYKALQKYLGTLGIILSW